MYESVAVDATVISPLHADGKPWAGAADRSGASFARAKRSKQQAYPELVGSSVLHLLVAAIEAGGRMNSEGHEFLRSAAASRAQLDPASLRRQAARSWETRWITLLSVAAQNAIAATMVQDGAALLDTPGSVERVGVEIWLDAAREGDLSSNDAHT